MQILIVIFLILATSALIWWIPLFKYCAVPRKTWILAWGVKLLAMLFLFLLYSQHSQDRSKADIFRYYDDGLILKEISKENPKAFLHLMIGPIDQDPLFMDYLSSSNNLDQRNQSIVLGTNDFIVKIHAIFSFIPYSSYHSNAILFAFLSFIGLLLFYSFTLHYLPEKKWMLFISIMLLPSILLWTSGPLKESLLLFGLGLLLRSGQLLMVLRSKVSAYLVFALSVFVLWNTRAFYAMILIPMFLVFLTNKNRGSKKPALNYFILLFLLFTVFWESNALPASFHIKEMFILKNQQFVELAQQENAGSLLAQPRLEDSLISFAKAIPHAIVNTLFRPLPWNIDNPMYLFMIAENFLLYVLAIFLIIKSKFKIQNKNVFYFLILSGFLILMVNGMNVPILGALARYRSLGLLFILLALMNLEFDETKWFRLKHK